MTLSRRNYINIQPCLWSPAVYMSNIRPTTSLWFRWGNVWTLFTQTNVACEHNPASNYELRNTAGYTKPQQLITFEFHINSLCLHVRCLQDTRTKSHNNIWYNAVIMPCQTKPTENKKPPMNFTFSVHLTCLPLALIPSSEPSDWSKENQQLTSQLLYWWDRVQQMIMALHRLFTTITDEYLCFCHLSIFSIVCTWHTHARTPTPIIQVFWRAETTWLVQWNWTQRLLSLFVSGFWTKQMNRQIDFFYSTVSHRYLGSNDASQVLNQERKICIDYIH